MEQGRIEFDREASPLFKKVVLDKLNESRFIETERIGTTNEYKIIRDVGDEA